MQAVLLAAEQFLRRYEVDERTDADFHVATADGGRLGFQGPIAVFVAPRGEHDVDGTHPREDPTAIESPAKWRASSSPSIRIPSGISSTRHHG